MRFSSAFRVRWRCRASWTSSPTTWPISARTGFKARSLRFEEYIMPGASADAFNPADQPALLRRRQGQRARLLRRRGGAHRHPISTSPCAATSSWRCRRRRASATRATVRSRSTTRASSSPATASAGPRRRRSHRVQQHRDRRQHRRRRHRFKLGRRQGQAEAHGSPQSEQPRECRHEPLQRDRAAGAAAGREARHRGRARSSTRTSRPSWR